MILELGCGTHPRAGAVNHDLVRHHEYVDISYDLNQYPWPWRMVDDIYALDVIEHLDNAMRALEECWFILRPGGVLHLRVPYGLGENAHTDLTHHCSFMPHSLDYFIRGTDFEKEYGFYSFMRWKLNLFWWNKDEDNMYWDLVKDEPNG